MSVVVKDMTMPSNCNDCNCFIHDSDYGSDYCCLLMIDIEDNSMREENCPLIPVQPHVGDLIDRKKLYEKTAEWEAQALHMVKITMHDEYATDWQRWSTILTERTGFKYDVADAPTIIPAEEV